MAESKPLSEKDWQKAISAWLRNRMAADGVTPRELAERLRASGVDLERVPLTNKINRGTFTAAFLLQVLDALGIEQNLLNDVARGFSKKMSS
ncbi:MAG: GMP synthase [Proteobacteria bacterium]|nr:GMP synthase [Pseudomonadota bacterium]